MRDLSYVLIMLMLMVGCDDGGGTAGTQSWTPTPTPTPAPASAFSEQAELTRSGPPVSPTATTTSTVADRLAKLAPPDAPPLAKGVVLELELQDLNTRRPVVVGETNLPDGTEILVSVEAARDFSGQADAVVKAGRFAAGPFGPEGGLTDGSYVADATMSIATLQPEAVKKVIGAEGERLKGKLVQRDNLGTWVQAQTKFFIGESAATAEKLDREALAKQMAAMKEIEAELRKLLSIGTGELALLRRSDDLDDLVRCGELMRKSQAQAQELEERAMKFPVPYRMIAAAAIHTKMCVSCLDSLARDNCKLAKDILREVKEALKK